MIKKILYKTISGVPVHTWLLLFIICMIGYWPVSSNLFSLKNDAYIYFLPCRYFISESIQNGHLPLWNPYFYMGFPLHGDMQAGVWNPVVWVFSIFGRYNMTMLQYETLLYIFTGGIGIYKLLGSFFISHASKLIVGVSYMFCGYVIDTGQITVWTGSAAFIPFVLLYYHRVLSERENIYSNALKTTIAFYFLFTAGYPSFLIMTCYICGAALISKIISLYRDKSTDNKLVQIILKGNLLIVFSFLLIALPALLSYIDYLPYYQRSTGTSLPDAQINPFNPFAVISYLFPLAVTKAHAWLTTDPTARSGYIGLFTFILIAGIFRNKMTGEKRFILFTTFICFLFSLGDATPVRKLFFHYVPLMNFFRHPGTMRIFTTCGLLIISSFAMDDFFIALKNKSIKYYSLLSTAAMLLIAIVMTLQLNSNHLIATILTFKDGFSSTADKRGFIKLFYDSFSYSDAVLLEGIIQLLFLLSFIYLVKRRKQVASKFIIGLFILNPIVLAQFSIPVTFVTRQSPAKINQLIKESPVGYPLPDINTTIAANDVIEAASNREFGCASFYTKKIVQVQEELNPSFTQSLLQFDSAVNIANTVLQYPICYFADTVLRYNAAENMDTIFKKILFTDEVVSPDISIDSFVKKDVIIIKQFTPWGLIFETTLQQEKPFVLFQNYNKNWQLFIDGVEAPIYKGNLSFMYATINAGQHELRFLYKPTYLFMSLMVSVVSFFLMTIWLIVQSYKRAAKH